MQQPHSGLECLLGKGSFRIAFLPHHADHLSSLSFLNLFGLVELFGVSSGLDKMNGHQSRKTSLGKVPTYVLSWDGPGGTPK